MVIPAYTGEISIPPIRGILGTFYQLSIVVGIFSCSVLGLNELGLTWRWISIICGIVPLLFLICVIFVPETPYYLLKKGRHDEAYKSMRWVRGAAYDMEPEFKLLQVAVKSQMAQTSRLSDLFQSWALKPFLVTIGLHIFQQMSGTNVVLFYTASIFSDTGSDLDPLVSAVICNSVKLAMTVLSVLIVDLGGRRILLMSSEAGMAVAMFALGTSFYLQSNDPQLYATLGWLPLVSLILFIGSFAIGLGPMPWLMTAEMLPRKVKGPAISIAAFINWTLAFVVTKTFDDMQTGMTTAGAYWFYGSFSVVGFIFCLIFMPETKGKTYEEIQMFFGNYPDGADHRSSSTSSQSDADKVNDSG